MAQEPKGHVDNYRVYTDLFISNNTHVEIKERNRWAREHMPPKKYQMDETVETEIEIDFFNATIFMSRKKAKELCEKLNVIFKNE